jgi:hypothetical protein
MAEKRGSTEKIKYDFPTEKDCQVLLKEKWYRTTPRDFRSWGGKRRIIYHQLGEKIIEEYNGPIYYWDTNKICKEPNSEGVQYISNHSFPSILRPGESKILNR